MTFNSYIFILVFLPVFVCLYFSLGKIHKYAHKMLLIIGSLIFYIYAGWNAAAILGLSIAGNYLLSLVLKKIRKKMLLTLAIAFNIGLLFYFKYFNFAVDTINDWSIFSFPHKDLILPLGISFVTFQQIMYVVSVWRGKCATRIADYLAYILFFPKLVMGPLMEPTDFFAQLNDPSRKNLNWEHVASGIKVFSLGLFKKMILADTFAKAVTWGFAHGVDTATALPTATASDLLLVMLFYTFQIYFDFSGYCDMGVGISKMLNIDLPINFNSPYKATSVRDFWKRWHISLTNFLTRYIYFPLGGSRKGPMRTYVNIMLVFLISGIWHGANWTFILWGCMYGLLLVFERLCGKWFNKIPKVLRWGYTFLSVNILWLLFRADSIRDWLGMLSTMFGFKSMAVSTGLIKVFQLPENNFIFSFIYVKSYMQKSIMLITFTVLASFICLVTENNYKNMKKINVFNMIFCALAFVWSFLCLGTESVFVYYNY